MNLDVTPYAPEHLEILRSLVRDPSLAPEFELVQGENGLETLLADPFFKPSPRWLGTVGGEPAGFCYTAVLPSWAGAWASVRIGVVERHRRRGLGTRLLEAATEALRNQSPDCGELT